LQQADQIVRDVLMHEQGAQRGAALARAAEGRVDDIVHRLLKQRRGIDNHRILAAGLGDERDRRLYTHPSIPGMLSEDTNVK